MACHQKVALMLSYLHPKQKTVTNACRCYVMKLLVKDYGDYLLN